AAAFFADVWKARNEYVGVILDRSTETLERFFVENASHELSQDERVAALELLEMQRYAMLMYTSCGWFFDEISGIETVQNMAYAARAIELAQQVFGDDLELGFLQKLAKAKSNLPTHEDGRKIYQTLIRPSIVDMQRVGSHYAVHGMFEPMRE